MNYYSLSRLACRNPKKDKTCNKGFPLSHFTASLLFIIRLFISPFPFMMPITTSPSSLLFICELALILYLTVISLCSFPTAVRFCSFLCNFFFVTTISPSSLWLCYHCWSSLQFIHNS